MRPFVCRLAAEHGIAGEVRNDAGGVVVEAVGSGAAIERFVEGLRSGAPPRAVVRSLVVQRLDDGPAGRSADPAGGADDSAEGAEDGGAMRVVASSSGAAVDEMTPDIAMCETCRAEIAESGDRRFGHALSSCTDCGPRFSITRRLPFDRPATSMDAFPLCRACGAEYHSPADRRFLAQTISCPRCGPRLRFVPGGGPTGRGSAAHDAVGGGRGVVGPVGGGAGDDGAGDGRASDGGAVAAGRRLLAGGGVLAVKGVGGYQLMADATDADAVARLRAAKRRPTKPLAVMFSDPDAAGAHVELTAASRAALCGPEAPIVIAPCRPGVAGRHPAVAPGLDEWGVMLANTPLHHLLLEGGDAPVVCTSGNVGGGPMVIDDVEARTTLLCLADAVLLHDREVVHRVDDAVVRQAGDRLIPVRRGRGQVPRPLPLPDLPESLDLPESPDLPESLDGPGRRVARPGHIVAFGADMKSTFSLLLDGRVLTSQYLGDLQHAAALEAFAAELDDWISTYRARPALVVADAHPGYHSAHLAERFAARHALPLLRVQHHRAHAAAVALEHRLDPAEPVLALVADGLGHGDDGVFWGCELFAGPLWDLRRRVTLAPVALPGGEAAIRHPWRMAAAHLAAAGVNWQQVGTLRAVPGDGRRACAALLEGPGPTTTSLGRLFDGVAFLLGAVGESVEYDGQAPALLEARARRSDEAAAALPHAVVPGAATDDLWEVLDLSPAWRECAGRLDRGGAVAGVDEATCALARSWHHTVVDALAGAVQRAAARTGITTVLLTGGCMQNTLLAEGLEQGLGGSGLRCCFHESLPANDGAVSAGQAWLAAVQEAYACA